MTIYLDLDGTILDVAPRYYLLHSQLIVAFGRRPLTFSQYWTAKRAGQSEGSVGRRCGLDVRQAQLYAEQWTEHIEDHDLLRLDRPLPGAIKAIARLHARFRVVLVSLRQRRDSLLEQLEWLGLCNELDLVLSADPRNALPSIKALLIRTDQHFSAADSVIIGDSEIDMRAGNVLGIPAFAVLSGIRLRPALAEFTPAWIGQSLKDAVRVLETDRDRPLRQASTGLSGDQTAEASHINVSAQHDYQQRLTVGGHA